MDALTRRRIEMAERVQAFFRTHPPEAGDVAALTRFEEVVQRAERLAGQQRAGLVAARAATLQRATVRRTIQRKLLRDISATRTQALAISLVLAAGVTLYVAYLSNFDSLRRAQVEYYERYRFADVFARVTRAPASLHGDLAALHAEFAPYRARFGLDIEQR